MPEAAWTVLISALAGGAVSIATAWLTAHYTLLRFRAEEDKADARAERQFERENLREKERLHVESVNRQITALEALSEAATRYYMNRKTWGEQNTETIAAGAEFARLAGAAYRNPKVAEWGETLREDADFYNLQNLLYVIEEAIEKRQTEISG